MLVFHESFHLDGNTMEFSGERKKRLLVLFW